jgi:hypothetical protein
VLTWRRTEASFRGMGHREWLVWVNWSAVRVKRWSDMVDGEVFQEATGLAALNVAEALSHLNNVVVANDLYADLTHRHRPTEPYGPLDQHALAALRRAFEQAHYVIVPLHVDPKRFSWEAVSIDDRRAYVMRALVDHYHYPPTGAAGVVGNLDAESDLLPDRLEQSADTSPSRAPAFNRRRPRNFSPTEIMNRSDTLRSGPRYPGVGLAQWTWPPRRRGLWQRSVGGVALGTDVLQNMDAQIEYVVSEIRSWGHNLQAGLMTATSVDDACDLVAYWYEGPGAMLDQSGRKRPMADPQVQGVFRQRRPLAHAALRAYYDALGQQ